MKHLIALLFLLLPLTVSAQAGRQPEARSGHEMVWHDGLGMVLLVNGDYQSSDAPGIVWGWDGEAWTVVSDDAPPVQSLAGVAYDAGYDTLLLHGGSQGPDATDYSDKTWTWDGETWATVEGTTPGARDHVSMVYDAAQDEVVLFGGQFFPDGVIYDDTWIWYGEGWVQTDAANSMGKRYHYAMTYDAAREQALVFGGTTGNVELNDLWAWDGSEWTQIDGGTGPSRRSGARMAYDAASGQVVLFGGRSGQRALDDTWLWDGEVWTEYEGESAPPARSHHAMAYDALREQVVLFGGYASDNLNDTWLWDSTNGWAEAGG